MYSVDSNLSVDKFRDRIGVLIALQERFEFKIIGNKYNGLVIKIRTPINISDALKNSHLDIKPHCIKIQKEFMTMINNQTLYFNLDELIEFIKR